MKLSIIIPVLNEEENLTTLLPLLSNTFPTCELIVADGGSNDRTASITQKHHVQLITAAAGRGQQMNAGAAVATGNVLLFLHADTQLPLDTIHLIHTAVSKGKQWGRFDVRLSGAHWMLRIIERMMNWRSCITGIATGDQGIFVSRRLFDTVAGFAEIPLMEDIELSKRLKRHDRPACIHTPLITSSRRWEKNGVYRTILLMWRLRLAYYLGASPHVLAQQYQGNRGK